MLVLLKTGALYSLFCMLKNSVFYLVLYHQCRPNASSKASPQVLFSASRRLWVGKNVHARTSLISATALPPSLAGYAGAISSLHASHSPEKALPGKVSIQCFLTGHGLWIAVHLATKLMAFWMLEDNFSLLSKSLNNWRFGCKSTNYTQFSGFFLSHSLDFFLPMGTETIYSWGGQSLQLINLSLACGLKRDTMPLSKARLAQKPMQNHHQILLEVENIS